RSASIKPIDDVTFGLQSRQRQNANAAGNSGQCARYASGVLTSCIVIVGQHDHVLPFEMLTEVGSPLAGAAGVASCSEPKCAQRIYVFLSFRNEHRARIRQQLWKPIRNAADLAQLPSPNECPATIP